MQLIKMNHRAKTGLSDEEAWLLILFKMGHWLWSNVATWDENLGQNLEGIAQINIVVTDCNESGQDFDLPRCLGVI